MMMHEQKRRANKSASKEASQMLNMTPNKYENYVNKTQMPPAGNVQDFNLNKGDMVQVKNMLSAAQSETNVR